MEPTYLIAKNFVKTGYNDLPEDVVEIARKEVLDSLGVALAGSSAGGIQGLIAVLKEFGGKKQSTVIAHDLMLPVLFAAQANASMMHALDYDDSVDQAVAHPGAVIVPVCFAVAEYLGGVSGKECITSLALGVDLMARLGLATKYKGSMLKAGWFYGSLNGYMTSAAVAGKLLGLDEEAMVNAIGIAYQKTSGNQQAVIDGALSKRMALGFAASGGIMAALMAQKGITGAKNCIEGEYGFYNVYHRGGYDRDALLTDLGKDFKIKNLTIKPYPSCRVTHPFIDAALALAEEHDIKAEHIKEVNVFGGEGGYSLSVPLEVKSKPRTTVDAQFSVPWAVATAIVKRRFSINDITLDAIKDKHVLEVAGKIKAQKAPELISHALEAGRVEVITINGTYVKQVNHPSGSPENPLSYQQCTQKFRNCASHSVKPVSREVTDKVIQSVSKLDEMDDITEIIRMIG